MMLRFHSPVSALLMILAAIGSPARSQVGAVAPASQSAPAASYPDSANGLQRCLADILTAAKRGDSDKVTALLKEMEIPNFAKWFNKAYGKQLGKDSAELYRMNVDYDEVKLAAILMHFTQQNGDIITRKVNDAPQPNTLEPAMLQASKIPTEIYFAGWRPAVSTASSPDVPIGYFVFIAAKFRWDTAINYAARHGAASPPNAAKPAAH